MSDLLVRNIPPGIKRQIKARARARGHSMSAEAQALIQKGLSAPEPAMKMGTWLFSLVRQEDRGDDLVFETPHDYPTAPDFE